MPQNDKTGETDQRAAPREVKNRLYGERRRRPLWAMGALGAVVGALLTALAGLVLAPLGVKAQTLPPAPANPPTDPLPDDDAAPFISIATGPVGGTYFLMGDVLAGLISHPADSVRCEIAARCGPPGTVAVAQASAGSVENVRAVAGGTIISAMVQADTAHWAYRGEGPFAAEAPKQGLRALARLYPESLHLIARRDAGITGLADLKGKRVSIDLEGSGTHATAQLALSATGLNDLNVSLLTLTPDDAAGELLAGGIDAMFFTGGAPVPTITALALTEDVVLLPVDGPQITALLSEQRFFESVDIPAGTYPGQDAVRTMGVSALWVTRSDLPQALAYRLAQALWHPGNRRLLIDGHPLGRLMDRAGAARGLTIPLHPGAERYYREAALAEGLPRIMGYGKAQ